MKRICLGLFCLIAARVLATSGVWTGGAGNGLWSQTQNWQDDAVPYLSGDIATLGVSGGAVTVDTTGVTLAQLIFPLANFVLSGNGLTFDSTGSIVANSGTQVVQNAIQLMGNTTFRAASGGKVLEISGALSGSSNITVYGGVVKLTGQSTYSGALIHKTGTVEVASMSALGAGAPTFGEGLFRYTGPSATMPGYTLQPNSAGWATAFYIAQSSTVVTVTGKVNGGTAAFIKDGPGALHYTYIGTHTLNANHVNNRETGAVTYDADGIAWTNSFAAFTIKQGNVRFSGAGQTNYLRSTSAFIGGWEDYSPNMTIENGAYAQFDSGYLTIGRGTGTKTSPQSPSVYVKNGGYLLLEGFVLANANGKPNYLCYPYLLIDSATVRVRSDCFLGENGDCTSRVDVVNGSLFQSDRLAANRALSFPASTGNSRTEITVATNSMVRTYLIEAKKGGVLNVLSGSVLEVDATTTNAAIYGLANDSMNGTVNVDNSSIRQRSPFITASWFMNLPRFYVGSGGVTLDVTNQAVFYPTAQAAAGSSGGTIRKAGPGQLYLSSSTKVPISVEQGTLTLFGAKGKEQVPSGSITAQSATTVELVSPNAGSTIALPERVRLTATSSLFDPTTWSYQGGAMPIGGGILQVTSDLIGGVGASFYKQKVNVSTPWTVGFTYAAKSASTTLADGLSFIIQNDVRGFNAMGDSANLLGYASTTTTQVKNSVAVGLDIYRNLILFGTNGVWVSTNVVPTLVANRRADLRVQAAYDGNGTLNVSIIQTNQPSLRYSIPVDIAGQVGGSYAYLGFAGGTGGSKAQQMISGLVFDNGELLRPKACQYGGTKTLGSSESLAVTLDNLATTQSGYALEKLSFADGATLSVNALAQQPALGSISPTMGNTNLWYLSTNAYWRPEGGIANSTPTNSRSGYSTTTNKYYVGGSWVTRFTFDRGISSGSPADVIAFVLHNRGLTDPGYGASESLSIMCRYYDGNRRDTQLRLYNGTTLVPTSPMTNTAPVDISKGAPVDFTITYNHLAQSMKVDMVQALSNSVGGSFSYTFTNVNVVSALVNNRSLAQIGFVGQVGGQWTENIIRDLTFTPTNPSLSLDNSQPAYFAINQYQGSGVLKKQGRVDLALRGDFDRAPSNVTIRLDEGALRIQRVNNEPLAALREMGEWITRTNTAVLDNGDLLACPANNDTYGGVTSARRIRIKEAFTINFTFLFGSRSSSDPADAFAMYFHNDPSGVFVGNGTTAGAGFNNVQRSVGLNWYFYQGNAIGDRDTIRWGSNGNWNSYGINLPYDPSNPCQPYAPKAISRNAVTDVQVKYDPIAKTFAMSMSTNGIPLVLNTNGTLVATNVLQLAQTIPEYVQDDYAYLVFNGGTGGLNGDMLVRNFRITYDAPIVDATERLVVNGIEIPAAVERTITFDTATVNTKNLMNSLVVGNGATVTLKSAVGGQLRAATAQLDGAATFALDTGTTLALDAVTGGSAVIQKGGGTLHYGGYADTVNVQGGTFALASPSLSTDVEVSMATTNSATLALNFTGLQLAKTLICNGVEMPGGKYTQANTSWISGAGALLVKIPGSVLIIR